MKNNYDKLKTILSELFEIDKADLDFGIYRIMNQKRDVVLDFIDNKLPNEIKEILLNTLSLDKILIEDEMEKIGKGLDAAGVSRESSEKYLSLKERLDQASDLHSLEQEIFSHLTNFFKRYYKDGDFISLRRYKKDVYAIPYEGEEVKLHWANADQYYIKTSEYLKNYSFKLKDGKRIHFRLIDASIEQNNNKAQSNEERRFALFTESPYEEIGQELYINFTYELYKKSVKQADLMQAALEYFVQNPLLSFSAMYDKMPTEKNKNRTVLEKHLTDYVSRNSFDYFIHKDLDSFLNRELDFYIKNEVLYIDDIHTEHPDFFVAQLSKIKALKTVARKIIQFLAQIEDFQKKLWLKKKFVIRTDYCITLDRIPADYYPEIFENEAQLKEWKKLYGVKIDNIGQLSSEPFLVLDTMFFSEEFKDQLLGEFDNLDEEINGILINSENFQALDLMQEKYKEEVDVIHIDPPYNTETSGFLYKNQFQSSSWISFMTDRVFISGRILNRNGVFYSHIDDNEYSNLLLICNQVFNINQGTIVWDKRNPAPGSSKISRQHEYIIASSKELIKLRREKNNGLQILSKAKELIKIEGVNETVRKKFKNWVSSMNKFSGGEKAYNQIDDNGRVFRLVHLGASEQRIDSKYFIPFKHPITGKDCPVPRRGWTGEPSFMGQLLENDLIVFGEDETIQPQRKYFLEDTLFGEMTSVITYGGKGKGELDNFDLEFPYSHSSEFYSFFLNSLEHNRKESLILDFFAGSGTTGHATIKLNQQDGGTRKYIMVEMGTYFDTVTKPRIQKVIYSDNWKNGRPQDKEGISHMFKYQVLESYEDTLNNLIVEEKDISLFSEYAQEQYLLKYMLDVETSDHLFDIEIFQNPFDYHLKVTESNELVPTRVDLVETFNYLIGLYVERIQRVKGDKRDVKFIEGKTREGQKTLIIWRNMEVTTNDETREAFRKLYQSPYTHEFDQIYINGDNNFRNFRIAEDVFKVKLIEAEFFQRMFQE